MADKRTGQNYNANMTIMRSKLECTTIKQHNKRIGTNEGNYSELGSRRCSTDKLLLLNNIASTRRRTIGGNEALRLCCCYMCTDMIMKAGVKLQPAGLEPAEE